MAGKYKRYDQCPAYQCHENITHVMVYGCLNGHILDAAGCQSHIEYWCTVIPKYHCGECSEQWEDQDVIVEKLWTATTH